MMLEKFRAFLEAAVEKGLWDSKEEVLEDTEKYMMSFVNYVNSVITEQIQMEIQKFRLEGEEWRDLVTRLDSNRRFAHESARDSITKLNRWSKNLGLPVFADIKLDEKNEPDRYEVADFCMLFVQEIYCNGTGSDLNDVVLGKKQCYDVEILKRLLREGV